MPKQTQAAVYTEFGEVDQINIKETELPELGEGEVLVRIEAAGVNPVDAAVMHGHLDGFLPQQFPTIPGWDMAGEVVERGFAARRFETGDKVYAYARRPVVQWGTFAEYTVLPESYLARRPHTIPAEAAGGLPLAGLTAYQSLYEAGNLQEGQTVLILGASGGVGSLGIQLAKARNARVIGVASKQNHTFMKKLGADETIDYKQEEISSAIREAAPKGLDLIFDCVSGETLEESLPALNTDGKLVSILNRGEDLPESVDHEYVFVEPNSKQLGHLRELVESGRLRVHVSDTFTLEEVPQALEQIQSLHTTGKIIITPAA